MSGLRSDMRHFSKKVYTFVSVVAWMLFIANVIFVLSSIIFKYIL